MVTKGFIVSIPVGDDNKYEVRLPFFEDAIEDAEEIQDLVSEDDAESDTAAAGS